MHCFENLTDDQEYFFKSRRMVLMFLNVTFVPKVLSKRVPEILESLKLVRHSQ
jgi:hypothetical protein